MDNIIQRAEILLQQNRPQQAEAELKTVLQMEPGNDHALALLGRCKMEQKQYEEALKLFGDAIAISPDSHYYFYLCAFVYYQLNNNEQAIKTLGTAIELNPYSAEYFGLLAHIYLEKVDFATALQYADEALRLDPENLTALNARSIALNKLKRTDEAIDTMNNALGQDPENPYTHNTIGWNLLEKGRHEQASKHFREALRLNPGYRGAQQGLKEAMKSKIAPYRWFLQYSFWLQNKGANVKFFILIGFVFGSRFLSTLSDQAGLNTLSIIIMALYLLFALGSWVITPLANIFLLFHPQGKYALDTTEVWSARSLMICLGVALLLLGLHFAGLQPQADDANFLLIAAVVAASVGIPLGHAVYPLSFRGNGIGQWMILGLAAFALFIVISGFIGVYKPLFLSVYIILFVIYSWVGGLGRNRT
jgi:tetratricopeptide (TPR) repeat protein